MPSAIDDGRTAALLDGLATALAEWDIASYNAAGYGANPPLRPIYFGPNEPATAPAERLILTPGVELLSAGRISQLAIGFNYRGPAPTDSAAADPLGPQNMLDLLYRRLHKLAHYTFGTVPIGLVTRQSSGMIGQDAKRRYGGSATYLFRGRIGSVNE